MNQLQTTPEKNRDLINFSNEDVALIKSTVAKGATDAELKLFLYQCRKTGLDPLAKQIYFQKRRTKDGEQMTILTGIDGYRLVADRTGKYAGSDDPVFDNEDNPQKATVTVYKMIAGVRCSYSASARWSQYYPGDAQGFMWRKMPHLMLGKCAEALALRKAFPAELSGVYTKEEMEQADRPEAKEDRAQAFGAALREKPTQKVEPEIFDMDAPGTAARYRELMAKEHPDIDLVVCGLTIAQALHGRPWHDLAIVVQEAFG